MSPSSAGKLRSLLDDRSRYSRWRRQAISAGRRDRLLSFRYSDVRCWRSHNCGLRFRIVPEGN